MIKYLLKQQLQDFRNQYIYVIYQPSEVMSGVYQCFSQRRGDVLIEENVQVYLPVAESFWFTAHLRNLTSGQAFPQLVFLIRILLIKILLM